MSRRPCICPPSPCPRSPASVSSPSKFCPPRSFPLLNDDAALDTSKHEGPTNAAVQVAFAQPQAPSEAHAPQQAPPAAQAHHSAPPPATPRHQVTPAAYAPQQVLPAAHAPQQVAPAAHAREQAPSAVRAPPQPPPRQRCRVEGGGVRGDPLPLQQHDIRYPIIIYVILGIVLHHVASNNVTEHRDLLEQIFCH